MDTTSAGTGAETGSRVGQLLRGWRAARGVSQLDLALRAGFSARHLSFVETGRSRPSRDALLALADALDVPLRERNQLLEAAGYADAYRETALDAGEMAHVRGVLQFILERHAPYPAIVLDRYSTCLLSNAAAGRLVELIVDPSLIAPHANHLRIAFHPLGARRFIANWDEVARHLLGRAERELAPAADDPRAAALLGELRGYADPLPRIPPSPASDLLVPIHIRRDALELRLFSTIMTLGTPRDVTLQELRLFSTIMTLGTPRDVTLQELRLETFFPADAASDVAWRAICGPAAPAAGA